MSEEERAAKTTFHKAVTFDFTPSVKTPFHAYNKDYVHLSDADFQTAWSVVYRNEPRDLKTDDPPVKHALFAKVEKGFFNIIFRYWGSQLRFCLLRGGSIKFKSVRSLYLAIAKKIKDVLLTH